MAHAAAQRADKAEDATEAKRFPDEPQENLLYFIEKNAPLLEPWQREIVRIVRKVAQYFYPQRQTQVMNEGWATFWHHHLLNTMYDDGHLTDGVMIEWLKSHTNVIYQPPVGHRAYSGINPYALGFAMYTDLKRICENADRRRPRSGSPTSPARRWLPALDHAMRNFKDESFIGQYLSPKLMRDLRLFAIVDDEKRETNSRSRRSTTTPATGACARRCRASTTWAAREPEHPGLERQPARRPLADAAPHPAQRPAAGRQRAGGAEARGAAVGLRRAASKASTAPAK